MLVRGVFGRVAVASPASDQAMVGQSLVAMDHSFLFDAVTQPSLDILKYCLRSAWGPGWQPKIAPKLPTLRRAEPGSPAMVIFRVRVEPGRGVVLAPTGQAGEDKVEPNA